MNRRLVFILILLANARACYCSILEVDTHGLKLSANDNFTIYTLDSYKIYFLHLLAGPIKEDCGIQYTDPNFYVYSLSAMTMRNNSNISFIQVAENITSNEVILSVVTFDSAYCPDLIQPQTRDIVIWSGSHQEYMSIKVDPQEKFAYVFADSFVLSYDLLTNMVDQFVETTNGTFWPDKQAAVRAFDLTNELALVAGYVPFWRAPSQSIYVAFLVQLRPFRAISYTSINDNTVSTAATLVYNREYDLPVSLDPSGLLGAIGAPRLNLVVLIDIYESFVEDTDDTFDLKSNQFALYASISSGLLGYGRSVAWLDDRGTLAVLVETSKNQVWSTSEVRVYSNISYSIELTDGIPDFVFPNNQQTLGNYLSEVKPGFIQILSPSNNLLVLTNVNRLLCIPTVEAGQNAVLRTSRTDLFTYIFEVNSCVSGTYKNKAGIGPCTVCPPQTKNPGNGSFLVTECLPCKQTSFCPLGATDDVNLDDLPSYIQTFAYHDSSNIDNFDDLLLLNFFTLSEIPRCVPFTALFWTLLIVVCCFTVWLIMYCLKICERRGLFSLGSHRKRAKIFFRHVNIIFASERWIGGLVSFAIFVLIGFTCWFSVSYFQLYPFGTSHNLLALCQTDLHNSAFDNALQLPLSNSDGSRWTIFDMLDSQSFSLSVDLINTAVQCTDIRIQQNRRSILPISIPIRNCTVPSNNITLSFSFDVPGHMPTMQIDIIGPYFIGGVRFCLYGPPSIVKRVNILHELDVCALFYTLNQTIGQSIDFTVRLIKVVNVTKPLNIGKDDQYDGRWAPTITTDTLSDKLLLKQNGQYMRYVSDRTTFIVQFTEESYFLQNNQKPLIRASALSFHTLLFISLIIEIFTTIFLLHKVCCRPLIKIGRAVIFKSCQKRKGELELNTESPNQTDNDSHSRTTLDGTQLSFHEPIPTNLQMCIDELVNDHIAKLIRDGYILRPQTHTTISERNT